MARRVRDYILGALWAGWFGSLGVFIYWHFPTNNPHLILQAGGLVAIIVIEIGTYNEF